MLATGMDNRGSINSVALSKLVPLSPLLRHKQLRAFHPLRLAHRAENMLSIALPHVAIRSHMLVSNDLVDMLALELAHRPAILELEGCTGE